MNPRPALLASLLPLLGLIGTVRAADPSPEQAEEKGLAFLSVEVPRWARENRCHSCHNNGDAAKALYQARRLGRTLPPADAQALTG
ncbi:MAG: hypothetical protein AB7I30_21150, partial [Isosphaeraceae bacterium]